MPLSRAQIELPIQNSSDTRFQSFYLITLILTIVQSLIFYVKILRPIVPFVLRTPQFFFYIYFSHSKFPDRFNAG